MTRSAADRECRRVAALALAAALLCTGWGARVRATPALEPATPASTGHVLYADVEGWYARTAHEVAVVSPFPLTLAGLPHGLPYQIGPWRGVDRDGDPEADRWLDDPEVAVTRTYRRDDGAVVWLSAYGGRGDASFRLFEHTPLTCYPLSGWRTEDVAPLGVDLGPRPLSLIAGTARSTTGELAFGFLYLWHTPTRDPALGLISLRLAAPATTEVGLEAARTALLEDFVPRLFDTTLPWSAF